MNHHQQRALMSKMPVEVAEWRRYAHCQTADDKRIFDALAERRRPSEQESPYTNPRILSALRYCEVCPVITECGQAALEETFWPASGVRGGRYIGHREARENLAKARIRAGFAPQSNPDLVGRRVRHDDNEEST